jgi:hypothetical protein
MSAHDLHNCLKNLLHALFSINLNIGSEAPVVLNKRLGSLVIDLEPFFNDHGCIILAQNQSGVTLVAAFPFLTGAEFLMKHLAALRTSQSARQPVNQQTVTNLDTDRQAFSPCLFKQSLQKLSLAHRSGESVQNEAAGAIFTCNPFFHHRTDQLIRNQSPGFHVGFGFLA